MKEQGIKFTDYVGKNGKSYHWVTPGYDFVVVLKPLNDWERWSIRGGKNNKVRMIVGKNDFINVSVFIVNRTTTQSETYRFQWVSFSEFERLQKEEFYAIKNPITGCEYPDWWYDKKITSIFEIMDDMLSGTRYEEALNCGGIESATFVEKNID